MASDEVKEVVGYLKHANPAVKQEACKILTQLCVTPSTFPALAALDVTSLLLPLVSTQPPLQTQALTLLVQLSTYDELAAAMLQQSAINISMEQVRTSNRADTAASSLPLLLQLLTNLTRTDKGAALLMQEGQAVETLHIRRLLSLFLQPLHPAIRDDKYAHVASLLLNVSQLPSGRRWLMDQQSGCVASLPQHILSNSAVRQRDILTLFRNLFLEQSNHARLLQPHYRVLENALLLIAGEGEVREEEREGFFPSVLAAMTTEPGRQPHADAAIRKLVLEVVALCARYKPSRLYLKQRRVYTVLRELHMKWEKREGFGSSEHDDMLYDIVQFFILDEETERPDSRTQAAERRERAHVEEVKEEVKEERKEDVDDRRDDDDKTAQLLSELSVHSDAVQADVQQQRAVQQQLAEAEKERRADIHQQMERIEREDASVEQATEKDTRRAAAPVSDDDEPPELVDEGSDEQVMTHMD